MKCYDLVACGSRRMSNGSEKSSKKTFSSLKRRLSGKGSRRKKSSTTSISSQSSQEISFERDDMIGLSPNTSFGSVTLDAKDETTYKSILRTLVSPLGASNWKSGLSSRDLTDQLQMIYGTDRLVHESWIREEEQIRKANTCTAMLYVRVIEAKDLPRPEGNGACDPYCLLSVVRPHKSNKGTPNNSPRLKSKKHGSFDMADVKKTRSIKRSREPKWNEEFEIDVQDVSSETLEVYLSLSDQQPFPQTLKTTEGISGLSGLFKQIKHTLEHDKSPDAFFGNVKIPLKDVPAIGLTSWFDISSKASARQKKCGRIKLQIELRYNKECAESDQIGHPSMLEKFHSVMMKFHQYAAKRAELDFADFEGKLPQETDLILDYFAVPHRISRASKCLLQIVCLLQMAVDRREARIKHDAIKEAISNFEVAWYTQQMDQPRPDHEVKGMASQGISETETHMFDQAVNAYVSNIIRGVEDIPHLFPPNEALLDAFKDKLSLIVRLLNVQSCSPSPSSRKDLSSLIQERIQSDVKIWIEGQLKRIHSTEKDAVIPELDLLLGVIQNVTNACTPTYSYTQFFSKLDIDYFKIVSLSLDGKLCAKTQELILHLDKYQLRYHNFLVNINQSCKLSLKLYMSLRSLYILMKENVSERQVFKLTISKFYHWFGDSLIFWLQAFRQESIRRMEKALEIDKDVVQVTSLVKYSNSSVDVLSCFSTIISEWKQIEYVSPDTNLMGVTKITDTICDGTRMYADKIRRILENNRYYDNSDAQFDINDQLCITLNNIEHVRQFLDELPALLHWEDVAEQIAIAHEEEEVGRRALITLHELVHDANNDVEMKSALLLQQVTERMSVDIKKYTELFTQREPHKRNSIDPLLEYFENNLKILYERLMAPIIGPMIEELWSVMLNCLDEKLLIGRPPDYYITMQRRLASLRTYFVRDGVNAEKLCTAKYNCIVDRLQINSLETEEILLKYYDHMSSTEMMQTPLDYYGHICIKLAYVEETRGNVAIYVKVLSASDLPGLDRSGLSDPFVSVSLCPPTLFPYTTTQKTRVIHETLNPTFNETFTIANVPMEFLGTRGGAIHLVVMDHDTLSKNDFAGEVFIKMSSIPQIKGLQTVDTQIVIMLPLKRPTIHNQPNYFQVAKERSNWDQIAKKFINDRMNFIENQPQRTDKSSEVPSTGRKILSKLCELFQAAKVQLNLCNEDATTEEEIKKDPNGNHSVPGSQNNEHNAELNRRSWKNFSSQIDHTDNYSTLKNSSLFSEDIGGVRKYSDSRENPFRFPPSAGGCLYARRRGNSDPALNPFKFDMYKRSLGDKEEDEDSHNSSWNQDDSETWDGYVHSVIPEESEPDESRRHSDPSVARSTRPLAVVQERQLSDPSSNQSSFLSTDAPFLPVEETFEVR